MYKLLFNYYYLVVTFAAVLLCLSPTANAGSKDLCVQGSDQECTRYGPGMCCAYINYTFKEDNQQFYACASRAGIEFTNGVIYDNFGFNG